MRSRRPKITREDIDEVWGAYGAKRIDDVVAEHKHQCPEIEEIITAFRGSERLLTGTLYQDGSRTTSPRTWTS